MKSCLEKNNTKMYSTHSEGKSAVAKRYMKTLKNDIYNHMIVASKIVSSNKLNDIVN